MNHVYRLFCRVCNYTSRPPAADNTEVTALCGAIYNTGEEEENNEEVEIVAIPCEGCFLHAAGKSCLTPFTCEEKWNDLRTATSKS